MKTMFRNRKKQKGMAVIESISLVIIFLTLFWYSIGFWGVIHTAILHSIAARNYTFEIFRHRTHLWHFRTNAPSDLRYHAVGARLHGANTDATSGGDANQYATERRIAMFTEIEDVGRSSNEHNNARSTIAPGERNTSLSLDPVWIMVQYGICLTAQCGD
ncbi:MAG: hypothetical protein K2Q26_01195 [Bdellovibrionales bacterium]|nr:hypothetical protein [Bdellovibrionales bacterium]